MKAKDLAALLLQTPEAEVYIEEYYSADFSDSYYYTNGTSGVTCTPSGVFINTTDIDEYPKAPSDKPRIGAIGIMMKDGEWFKLRMDEHGLSVLADYANSGYICNYISWHDDYYVLCPSDFKDGWVQETIAKTGSTHYTPDEVDYVQILAGLDDTTWNPIYIKLSFDEAIKYALEKQNG